MYRPAGNVYDKYGARNPLVRLCMRSYFRTLRGLISEVNPRSILDVGCGEGIVTAMIAQWFTDTAIEASDVDPRILAAPPPAAARVRFSTESAYKLTRPDKSFDLVTGLEVLEHLDNPRGALE